jgi:hypothetical protein
MENTNKHVTHYLQLVNTVKPEITHTVDNP